jgi:hypothetical protein
MNDEPQKRLPVGKADLRGAEAAYKREGFLQSEEELHRAEEAFKKRGLDRPETARNFANTADWASEYEFLRDAGMDRETYLAGMDGAYPNRPLLNAGSVEMGALGAGVAAAGVPVAQFMKNGRTSWQSFMRAAPKTAAVGLALGLGAGMWAAAATNRSNELMRAVGRATWEDMEAAWQKRESEKKAARVSAPSPAK